MSDDIPTELDALKERADKMGITYHPTIGLDKLREKVNAVITPKEDAPTKVVGLTPLQIRKKKQQEARKLVRVRLTCHNPNKSAWDGEIMSISNSVIGIIKKFIPFQADEGWHIEQALLNMIRDRKYQTFYTVKKSGSLAIRKGKLVPEFAIEVLPALTAQEIEVLAKAQAARAD